MTRQLWPMHGGIHPAEHKSDSLGEPIQTAPLPEQLVLPMGQHLGAPAKALVEVGDKVLKGQEIAAAAGFVSAPVHASTSGTVVAIELRPVAHQSGMSAPCIVIEPDGQDTWIEHSGIDDYRQTDKKALLNTIRGAGIVGMGGAGFPSSVKLGPPPNAKINTLIINGTECEPYITADDMLMRERANEIIQGVEILAYLLDRPSDVVISVEDNKPEAIAALRAAITDQPIHVVVLPTKYPSGSEKMLIQMITGREVPSGGLPADVGVVVQNIGTTSAVYRAVVHGEPLISRITTVTGGAINDAKNFEVRLGTPVKHLLQLSGYEASKANRLIAGGPMMGFTLDSDETPVVKTSNCVLAPTEEQLPTPPPHNPCIRCGACAEACPVELLPQQLFWYSEAQDFEKLDSYNLMDCIECGCCSFSCPSNIPLVQYYRASKGAIRTQAQELAKAERSRQRFEARQERIAKEEAEKEAKRQARKAAAEKAKAAKEAAAAAPTADTAASDDPVKAAMARVQAQQASPEEQLAKLQKAVDSARTRVEKAETRLQDAKGNNPDKVEQLSARLEDARKRLQDAEQKLKEAPSAAPAPTAAPASTGDAAQDAIERAKAKAAAAANMSPEEKLQQSIATLEKRVTGTSSKLEKAEAEGSDKADILRDSLAKQEQKLADEKAKLAEQASAPAADLDPAQAAIERAKANAAALANMSPAEKLQKNVDSLAKRVATTRDKLASAEAEGSDKADILRDSLAKQEEKLNASRDELAKLAPPAATEPEPAPVADDPAQAAIDRAKANAAALANMSPAEKLQKNVDSLAKRVATTREKLTAAEAEDSDKVDILRDSLAKQEEKLTSAREELAKLVPPVTAEPEPAPISDDPAQAAIDRAKAKAAAQANMSPEEKLQQSVDSLEKRVASTRDKLSKAEAEDSDKVDILRDSLAKQEEKLAAEKAKLAALSEPG